MIQHQKAGRYQEFGVRVAMNSEMLREVGGQLLYPTLRAAAAADDIILAVSELKIPSTGQSK